LKFWNLQGKQNFITFWRTQHLFCHAKSKRHPFEVDVSNISWHGGQIAPSEASVPPS